MKTIDVNDGIEVKSVTNCCLCGTEGKLLYSDLRDRFFDAPGEWDFKKCCNPECELVWLDPIPTEADLHRVYENYFTHHVTTNGTNNIIVQSKFVIAFRMGLKLGYQMLAYFTGMNHTLSQARHDLAYMYLAKNVPGKLLDVGCGNGIFLDRMRALGWTIQGVEVDHKAAAIAEKEYGIPMFVGSLTEARYPSASLDAISMHHVIEHVHDPIALLRECHRLLKPGGHLIVVTPNVRSLGHARFGQHWRGLEPPRHLHLFSQLTLEGSARKAKFRNLETWTTPANAEGIATASLDIQYDGRHALESPQRFTRELLAKYFQLRALAYYWINADSGEEVILKACK
jgi:2-polyprenyl-3-methyl-5-hydroxy-6-metoxy-1,4-benzoquinol methylase